MKNCREYTQAIDFSRANMLMNLGSNHYGINHIVPQKSKINNLIVMKNTLNKLTLISNNHFHTQCKLLHLNT